MSHSYFGQKEKKNQQQHKCFGQTTSKDVENVHMILMVGIHLITKKKKICREGGKMNTITFNLIGLKRKLKELLNSVFECIPETKFLFSKNDSQY